MAELRWFKTGVWRDGFNAMLSALHRELFSLQPQDSATIVWTKTANGMQANLKEQTTSAGATQGVVGDSKITYNTVAVYSGYFKLYLINDSGTYKVRIADGATYQNESSVGGNSTCKVNNATFSVAPYLSSALTANTLFYLKYDHSLETVVLESSLTMTIPSDTDTIAYYQLGRFYLGVTVPYIWQDHSTVFYSGSGSAVMASGIPQIWWVKNEC